MNSVQQTLNHLRELRLTTMAHAYQIQLEQSAMQELSFDDRLSLLVERELAEHGSRRLHRLIRSASFPEIAVTEDLDYRPSRGMNKARLAPLIACEWIRQRLNLMVHGPTGAGKTWLVCALGTQACRMGLSVAFRKAGELYSTAATATLDGSLPRLKTELARPDLLILDDFGIGEMNAQTAHILLDVVDRRMRTGFLLIASQYPIELWHACFPDPMVADAVLVRIVHQSYRIILKGNRCGNCRRGNGWGANERRAGTLSTVPEQTLTVETAFMIAISTVHHEPKWVFTNYRSWGARASEIRSRCKMAGAAPSVNYRISRQPTLPRTQPDRIMLDSN
ncbi:IS21-like element helper ATPase IstB [Burkholderia sp. MR1-5-21]